MNQFFDRSFLRNLWRRWPITIVTTTLAVPIASWAYIRLSVRPSPTVRAYAAEQKVLAKPSGAVLETSRSRTRPTANAHRALPSFRRVDVAPNEVDYLAEDVTVRIFKTRPKAHTVASGSNQVEVGDDVTVHYFADNRPVKAER